MNIIWILVAFTFGFVVKQIGLPPLIGYLSAGFILHAVGIEPESSLETLADLGITLMLFTIGLKVNFRQLMRLDIWGGTLSHMSLWVIFTLPFLTLCSVLTSIYYFDITLTQAALIGFALSFSSTVCAIKVLEDNSELKTKHSDLAIGVLIIQDIAAVLFLLAATGKVPSLWAISLLGLFFLRPLIRKIFDASGHGELIPLLGFMLALGSAELFELVGLKGDLGALVVGMLIAGLPKTNELYKSLISFKDLFLIGFFLSIGFTALPTLDMWFIALAFALVLPLKLLMFFFIFVGFSIRARTSFLSALLLTNYSEFGLIVASLSVDQKWLSNEWLVIIALSISLSFICSTLLYKYAHTIYGRKKDQIIQFQRPQRKPHPPALQSTDIEVLIVGMGRVGTGAYHELVKSYDSKILGIEVDQQRADIFQENKLNVVCGDADDIEFWEQVHLESTKLIMLAIPSVNEMKNIIYQLKLSKYTGRIAVIARYEDERQELLHLGADVAFNYYAEVGMGFAEESMHLLKS
mgnify:CR=1 FL=1